MSREFLVTARYLVPVRPRNQVLEHHSVVIKGKKIHEILPRNEAIQRYPQAPESYLRDHVLLPGLINMHSHAPMSLLRGYADDLDMQSWLQDHIWPIESRHVSGQFVADGTRLAVAEMLRCGTTCFNELYFFPDIAAEVVRETGIRACLGFPVLEVPTPWSESSTDCLDKATEFLRSYASQSASDDRVSFSLAPHAPYSVGDDAFREIVHLSMQWGLPVHLHLLETGYDVRHSLVEYSERPLQRLDRLGVLNHRLQAVHMTQLEKADMELLKERGVHVIHCPRSNLKLASGHCPVAALMQAGVNVSVGTDGAASNNRLDVLSEAQIAGLLAKGQSGDAACVDAFAQLEMITINAANALGKSETLGSIESGKWADLTALDLAHPETQPLHNVVSQIAYAASSRQVTDVWVAGEHLLQNGVLERIDLAEVLETADHWRARISAATSC